MLVFTSLSDGELLSHLPGATARERSATAGIIACLAEVDRRRLYLSQACSSLQSFCVQRLGYSENEAQKRIQVARLYRRLPRVLVELESGAIHLTGLFVLSAHLTDDNAETLLGEARGRTRREIEAIVARWFPRSDVLPSMTPLVGPNDISPGIPGNCDLVASTPESARPAVTVGKPRIEPLSARSYRVEFTASAELHQKIEKAQNLLSHAVPSGALAQLFDRALDALVEAETKRRFGAGKPRRRRDLKAASRHVAVDVARAVWERDGNQCTFIDAQGRRCAERRFLTLEHCEPFAKGGASDLDNLCLLCGPHNAERARQEYGEAHIEAKRLEAAAHEKTLGALVRLGFARRETKSALESLRQKGSRAEVEPLLRAALALLVQ